MIRAAASVVVGSAAVLAVHAWLGQSGVYGLALGAALVIAWAVAIDRLNARQRH